MRSETLGANGWMSFHQSSEGDIRAPIEAERGCLCMQFNVEV